MQKEIKNVDSVWLTKASGDPFVDLGGYVIEHLQERYPGKSIVDLIDYTTNIYVNDWGAKLNTFFLNSKITQPSFKGNRKIEETKKYFNSLLNNVNSEIGYCRITGRNTFLFDAGRDNSIMSGSGKFVNFHRFLDSGIKLSKEVLIRFHFVPLGSILLSGKVAVVHSNDKGLNKFFAENNVDNNLSNIGSGLEVGVLKSEFRNPANALFDFIDSAFENKKNHSTLNKPVSLVLYHFTNFGASPEIEIFRLPALVFSFYTRCHKIDFKDDWLRFVRSNYSNSRVKDAEYNFAKNQYEIIKKDKIEAIVFDDFKVWTNRVYTKLLNGKSLVPDFYKWSKKGNKINFDIIRVYQQNIGNMKKETIDKILELADFLTIDRSEEAIKKSIKQINASKKAFTLRRFLLRIIDENYRRENADPIITVDDYTNYLFSDDNSWYELRDLLLIAIYQKMHELNLKIEVEEEFTEELDENN